MSIILIPGIKKEINIFMKISIIVATDKENGIGVNNQLPWHIPKDMQHFKTITETTEDKNKTNAVIMGRKTWNSIPERFKPLKNRENIILTRQNIPKPHNTHIADSFETALSIANKKNIEQIFIIGGASIYKLALNHPALNNIYIIKINHKYNCDTFLPIIEQNNYTKKLLEQFKTNKNIEVNFYKLTKNI